jgi:hypothetical protein
MIHARTFIVVFATVLSVSWTFWSSRAFADDVPGALARASALVDQASAASGTAQDRFVADALRELSGEPSLRESGWLQEPLRAVPPNLPLAKVRIIAAIDAVSGGTPVAAPDQARANLKQVLDGPRFHPHTWQDDLPAFLLPVVLIGTAVAQFVWNLIRWPFDRLGDLLLAVIRSPAFGPLLAVGAVVVAGGIVMLYRRGLRAIMVAQAEAAAGPAALPLTAAEALAAGQRESSLGRYRAACHFVLLATLLWIEENGAARFDRSATNREHLGRLAAMAALPDRRLVGALEPVIHRFDHVWYGQSFASDDDYRDLLALAGRVRDALK